MVYNVYSMILNVIGKEYISGRFQCHAIALLFLQKNVLCFLLSICQLLHYII